MQARFTVIQPAKHLPGIVGPTNVMLYSVFLMTNDKLDAELAYKLAAALHDNKAMIAEVHPVLHGFEPGRMTEKSETPYHDGAIKYYREVGQWPPKD